MIMKHIDIQRCLEKKMPKRGKLKVDNGMILASEPEKFNKSVDRSLDGTSKKTRMDARKYREFARSRLKRGNVSEEESEFRCSLELTKDDAQVDPHMRDGIAGGDGVCYECMHGGVLLHCHGKGCQRRYHPSCLDPPLNYVPPGVWHCPWCVKKKIELGVYSISHGIESIWDVREVMENEVMERQYLVKYQDLAHAHNRWIPEKYILLEAPKRLAKFNRKVEVIRWKREWTVPHRLLLKRLIVLPKQYDEHFDGQGDKSSNCHYEWLVKWTGLGYDHITWELDDASFMTSSGGMKLIADYESRHKKVERLSNPSEAYEVKASSAELTELPAGDSPGLRDHHLSYVNKLCMYWHEGQSALVVDEKVDQERVMKVILFLSSFHHNIKRPFLIISTSAALSVWEAEFLHLAPSANLVVYKGDKNLRSSIRAMDFYNDDGTITFQILLSSSDIVTEDLHALQCIAWEVIIIDECQSPRISRHFDNIKMLTSNMRLLLVSGQIKECSADYLNLLSLLDSGSHAINNDQLETELPTSIPMLKKLLAQYVAYECKKGSSRFIEYWVPAMLSNLQLEQYCSMLLSNKVFLCSGLKTDPIDALRDLIISTKKCCNHPYLLDQSLHSFVTKERPIEEYLDIGIKASGKLQLLEKILIEVKNHGLRAMILFESAGGSGSIGNILDDVVCQRFGKDCYVRYGRGYKPTRKQAALDMFNDKAGGKFVFLIDNRSCVPSIKLSSVDTIILFDSDWDSQNDLRALQRMSISSQFEQLTVFRLYSSFTIEEKVLMLAKEGIALDSNMQCINQSTCHTLLKWDASYLFNKLDDLHASDISVSATDISSDQSFLHDVICELSSQLPCGNDTDCHNSSFILKVEQNGGVYSKNNILLGERSMKKLDSRLSAFSWTNLFERRNPRWKFLSISSQRIRKKVKYCDQLLQNSEFEDVTLGKRRTVSKEDIVGPMHVNSRLKNKKKQSVVNKTSKVNDNNMADSKIHDSIPVRPSCSQMKRLSASDVDSVEQSELLHVPKSTEFLPKPDISGLCDVLRFSKEIKAAALKILKYILKHYDVDWHKVSTVQAFEISVCWLAASVLKHKIDKKESLALAKLHLHFDCKDDEATYVYSKLKTIKKILSRYLQKPIHVEKCYIKGTCSKTPERTGLVEEEMQTGFKGPDISCFVESVTDDLDLKCKSPLRGQNCVDKLPSTTPDVCQIKADALSLQLDAENDKMNALASEIVEVSFLCDQNEAPNPSKDPCTSITVTYPLDSLSPVINAETLDFVGEACEDAQLLKNDVGAGDNSMNVFAHPEQLNRAEVDAITFTSAAVTQEKQVCDESTVLEYTNTTAPGSPYLPPSHGNLGPLPQNIGDCFNNDEAELIDPLEPFNSSLVQSTLNVPQQPCVGLPTRENAMHVPFDSTANPGYLSIDPFHAPSVTSEMPDFPCSVPLQIEMERIQKEAEEAIEIHNKAALQLRSDFEKDSEKIRVKYDKLLQNVDSTLALKGKELETNYNTVHANTLLAEAWLRNCEDNEMAWLECTEQVAVPNFSSPQLSMNQTGHMPADRLEQYSGGLPINYPYVAPQVLAVNPSTAFAEISSVRQCFSPPSLFSGSLRSDFDLRAPAPHLRFSVPATSSMPHHNVPITWSGISDKQLLLDSFNCGDISNAE
ncbi:hypothetical protein L6164_033684 [Bauhinia variegata]|uniref:Uncharacterized protein n=1 Tax=Bauhinia variegata TaxID=167791 RepID=A0ACB9KSG2_BAUVA|nr:hypothetical protein L6164_033684 [Bauhinia variegata]